jgi:hypothetical protein
VEVGEEERRREGGGENLGSEGRRRRLREGINRERGGKTPKKKS